MTESMIEIKTNAQEVAQVLPQINVVLYHARSAALSTSGVESTDMIRRFIETQGAGTWPKTNPITAYFEKRGNRWVKRSRSKQAYVELGKFARYQKKNSFQMQTGFGIGNRFDPLLMQMAKNMVRQNTSIVTDKARRKIAATNEVFLRKTTTLLQKPARPLDKILQQIQQQIGTIFVKRYDQVFVENQQEQDL